MQRLKGQQGSRFKQIARQVATSVSRKEERKLSDNDGDLQGTSSPFSHSRSNHGFRHTNSATERTGSDEETGLSLHGNHSNASSGEGSDAEGRGGHNKKGGLFYQKTENFLTRIRDMIAMSDVFISRGENPPFIGCIQVSIWFIPVLILMCLWDTLAVTVFQTPHLSTVNLPGFLLGWHFVMMVLAMYGFMLSYLSSGNSPRTKMAAISLGVHYLLLTYRALMEIFFNGYRGEWKLYYESTKKVF